MSNPRRSLRLLPLIAVLASSRAAFAADVPAASCDAKVVQAAIDSAIDGDTVTVPACDGVTWTGPDDVVALQDKAVTVQGAGIGKTNITLQGEGTLSVGQTKSGPARLTGFSFADVGTVSQGYVGLSAAHDGDSSARIDHCSFTLKEGTNSGNTFAIAVWGGHLLVDHNQFVGGGMEVADTGADISRFREPIVWGAGFDGHWVFIEDNTFDAVVCEGDRVTIDVVFGAPKIVFRHNTLVNGFFVGHGACWSSLGTTGLIAADVYANEFGTQDGCTFAGSATDIMGGTLLFHENTVKNVGSGKYGVDTCATDTTSCPHNFQDVRTKDAPAIAGSSSHYCNTSNNLWMYCDDVPDKWCQGSDDEHWYTCDQDSDCDGVPKNWGLPPMGTCSKMRCSSHWTLCEADADCPSGETCSKYLDDQTADGTVTRCFNGNGTGQLDDATGTIKSDPMYGWNNNLAACAADGSACQTTKQVLLATGDIDDHTLLGRDVFNEKKPGYCPFTYPHPLTGLPADTTGVPPECVAGGGAGGASGAAGATGGGASGATGGAPTASAGHTATSGSGGTSGNTNAGSVGARAAGASGSATAAAASPSSDSGGCQTGGDPGAGTGALFALLGVLGARRRR